MKFMNKYGMNRALMLKIQLPFILGKLEKKLKLILKIQLISRWCGDLVTKWKNKTWFGILSFFITIGIIGIYTLITLGPHVIYKSYFDTPEFQREIDAFVSLLYL